MQALLDAVVDLAGLVSPSKVRAISATFRNLRATDPIPSPNSLAETPAAQAAVARLMDAWRQESVNGTEVAGMLLGAAQTRVRLEHEHSVELVWTGPTTRFVPTRRTEQVLLDLIASAKVEVFLVSFVAFDIDRVVRALNDAARRGVRLCVLLEASTSHGGTLNLDPASMMRARVPTTELFTWKEKPGAFADGKVHAKLAVIDRERAFITSANLTSHALAKNMEAGVLINGGLVPKTLSDHLQALIDVRIIDRA